MIGKLLLRYFSTCILLLSISFLLAAQFRDDFDSSVIQRNQDAALGWDWFSGDGQTDMDFRSNGWFATVTVNAQKDKENIWWALIRRHVSDNIDLKQLADPGMELRIEARIRVSHAPSTETP